MPAQAPDEPAPDRDELIGAFAHEQLGPASERHLGRPEVRARVDAWLDDDKPLADAVLAAVHAGIGGNAQLADEFATYFLKDLMKMGRVSMSSKSKLRRFLDTGDLVMSVFGDLWSALADLEFTSEASFRSLFARRMQWKAADRSRQLTTQRRAEDRRVAESVEDIDAPDDEDAALRALRHEEVEELAVILARLSERERRLLDMHWKGWPLEDIASELDITYDAARVARNRAITRAKQIREERDKNA